MAKRKKRALTFQQIKDADDRPSEAEEVPEWGGVIYLKPLSGEKTVDLADKVNKGRGSDNDRELAFIIQLCGECIVDEDDRPIFTGREIEVLQDKSFPVLYRIGKRLLDMHGMTERGIQEKKRPAEPQSDAAVPVPTVGADGPVRT